MLTLLNRRELLCTFSMREQGEIRGILSRNKLEYSIKTVNRLSPSPAAAGTRANTGSLGQNLDTAYEYIVYVRRRDWEKARALTGR